jgi:hypothetical protein
MSTAAIVADTLRAWREAERLLDAFPPGTTDHETVRLLIVELRGIYAGLTEAKDGSDIRLRVSAGTIERAQATIARLEAKRVDGPGSRGSDGSDGPDGSDGSAGPDGSNRTPFDRSPLVPDGG